MDSTTWSTARSVDRNLASWTAWTRAGRLVADTWWATATVIGTASLSSYVGALQLVGELGELVASGHLSSELVQADLGPLLVQHGLTQLQDDEVVADQIGVMRVVGDEHNAQTGVSSRRRVLENDAGLLDAESSG